MFFSLFQLAVESNAVIGLRTVKFMLGHGDAIMEGQLMVTEKVDAAVEAASNLFAGASADTIIERYRQHVAANAKRLSIIAR